MLTGGRHSPASLAWALGVVIWQVLTPGSPIPYSKFDTPDVKRAILSGNRLANHRGIISHRLWPAVINAWTDDPRQRATVDQLAAVSNFSVARFERLFPFSVLDVLLTCIQKLEQEFVMLAGTNAGINFTINFLCSSLFSLLRFVVSLL